MTTLVQITLTNNSLETRNFFFFQQPSIYFGGSEVYSNSVLDTKLGPNSIFGSNYVFQLEMQYYAGVQDRHGNPIVGMPSGYTSAMRPIELTPATGVAKDNCTEMTTNPLGLLADTTNQDVQKGAFRIVSPTFDPSTRSYNGGSALKLATGPIVLSNFITVSPTSNLDCQPVLKFYVQTGDYTAGTVMNFTSSSKDAALCDATTGITTFAVSYNLDGTWTVTSTHSKVALTYS